MIHSILVPTDLSRDDGAVVAYASRLARQFQAKLTLLYTYRFPGPPNPASFYPALSQGVYDEAMRDLARLAQAFGNAANDTRLLVRTGDPGSLIVAAAQAGDVDLVVMGSHRVNAVRRALHGRSVSAAVASKTTCPVLIVPVADHEAWSQDALPPPAADRAQERRR